MPIDSSCSGCGKTLRVNDEFVGRKARCPSCGNVYVVGQASPTPPIAHPIPSVAVAETTYVVPGIESDSPSLPMADQKYFVRTPNSMIYGPSDKAAVLDWIDQGRLDDTCHIREESSEQWLGLAAWRFQTRQGKAPVSSPVQTAATGFGEVPRSSVQSAGYAKSGNGTLVLVLGSLSWLLCPTVIGGWICAILAIVLASFEFNKIRNGQTPFKERWLVLLGMWLGIVHLVAWVLCVIGLIIVSIVSN
jgi:hypothetical protein